MIVRVWIVSQGRRFRNKIDQGHTKVVACAIVALSAMMPAVVGNEKCILKLMNAVLVLIFLALRQS